MKQVFFTSCKHGDGLEDISGQQIRAASAGLSLERMKALKPTMGYTLPARLSTQITPEEAPVRLALMRSAAEGGERVLVHVTYVQVDPASGRLGNSFVHLLTDLPPDFTIQQAIQSWGSAGWVRSDPGGGTSLDELIEVPVGPLTDQRLIAYAQTPAGATYLEFLATAVLCREPDQRVFLVSEPDDAALLIYGLARLVPEGLLRDFNFSTYERYPENSALQLVATCWPNLASQDLPMRCYEGIGLALHTATGHQSTLKQRYAFITAGLAALKSGDLTRLSRFHEICAEQQVSDLNMVELIYDLFFTERKHIFTASDIAGMAKTPRLLSKMCQEPGFLEQALLLAEQNEAFLSATFPHVVASCQQQPIVLATLLTLVKDQGYLALKDNAFERARRLFAQLLPVISAEEAVKVRKQVLGEMSKRCSPATPASTLALTTRVAIAQFATVRAESWTEPALLELASRWIQFNAEEVARWLQKDLAQPIRRYVAIVALMNKVLPAAEIVAALADDQALCLKVYHDLANEQSQEAAGWWFSALAPTPKRLLELLRTLSQNEQSKKSIRFAWTSIQRALAQLDEHNFQTEDWKSLLEWFGRHKDILSKELQELVTAWNILAAFLEQPDLSEQTLKNIQWSSRIFRARTGTVPAKSLISMTLAAFVETQDEVELVLLEWGAAMAANTSIWYSELLQEITKWQNDWATSFFPLVLIYLGLGGTSDKRLAKQLQTEELIPSIEQALLNMDKRMYKMIARSAKDWSNPMRKQWTKLQIERSSRWRHLLGKPKSVAERSRQRQ